MSHRLWLGGFEVISEPTQLSTGIVRCGGCSRTMSHTYTARETHRRECPELSRLERWAEAAVKRAARRGE